MAKDILLDNTDDLAIIGGDFAIGESTMQEVGIILRLNQGQLRQDPILGPNLVKRTRSTEGAQSVVSAVKRHLERDKKSYESLKQNIKFYGEQN